MLGTSSVLRAQTQLIVDRTPNLNCPASQSGRFFQDTSDFLVTTLGDILHSLSASALTITSARSWHQYRMRSERP
jgi:hypothetical protein